MTTAASTTMPFTGKAAIVTGASRGIGAAIARRFAELGAAVVIDYLSDDERALATATAIEQQADAAGRVAVFKADVRSEERTRALASFTEETFGGVDILVNNALSHYSFDPRRRRTFDGISWDDYREQIDGCLRGAYNTCAACVPRMRRQAGGAIVNISSNLVDAPIVPYHDYTAAKGSLVGFTRSLAQELGKWGIRVNAVAAGLTAGTDSSRATTEDVRERIVAMTPLGRLATADDIAGAVMMLAGDDAGFITGQTLHADGGLVMR